jgi:starvation-inducible DNA-binding protein
MANQNLITAKIPPILMRTLASTYVLYYSAQAAHWNVEGPYFVQLHDLFKDIYDDAAKSIDEIAERIRQLDVKIPPTIKELIEHSPFEPDKSKIHVEQLLELHAKLEDQWNAIAVVAEAAEDAATVDMAGKKAGTHAMFKWMLRSLTR